MPKRRVKDRSLKAVISKIEEEREIIESVEAKTFEQLKRSTRKKIVYPYILSKNRKF